jgi:RNA polymerase sigma factor (sigma-70 family)
MGVFPSSSPQTTRASLLLRLRPGDPGREVAWAEFYDLYAPIISGFARRIGASRSEVEDLVQEVLRAFFSASPEFSYDPAKGRFRGYLKTCVWHKMSELRRKAGRQAATLGKFPFDDDKTVEETWNDVWETEKLHRALAAVRERYANNPDRQRTFRAFEMCTLLDRSTEAVAAALGMSEESVRQSKSRVGKALRETFDHLDNTTG